MMSQELQKKPSSTISPLPEKKFLEFELPEPLFSGSKLQLFRISPDVVSEDPMPFLSMFFTKSPLSPSEGKTKTKGASSPFSRIILEELHIPFSPLETEELYIPSSTLKALNQACTENNAEEIKQLCEKDNRLLRYTFNFSKEEREKNSENCKNWQQKTILHLACSISTLETIKKIVELAEKHTKGLARQLLLETDPDGLTPIHYAILGKQNVEILLTLGAWTGYEQTVFPRRWKVTDKRALDEALAYSIGQKDLLNVRFFLRLGANPQATNAQGESLLYVAAKAGLKDCVAALVEAKADPNIQDTRMDDTPLEVAVRGGKTERTRVLQTYRAGLENSPAFQTAFQYAVGGVDRHIEELVVTLKPALSPGVSGGKS